MTLQGYYTNKGRELAAKVAGGTAPLTVTRVVAGSGHTADIPSATSLPDIEQTLTVGTAVVSGTTATLPVTLAEASAAHDYTLTELGVYASDPDEGEILFQVYQLSAPQEIAAHGEGLLRFYLRQSIGALGVTVTCAPAGILVDEDLDPLRSRAAALEVRVNAASIPSRTVTVAAEDLQDYLDNLPKLLTESLTINVGSGTISKLTISGFYGSGSLTINGNNALVLENSGTALACANCQIQVNINNMTIHSTRATGGIEYLSRINGCRAIYFNGCTLTGTPSFSAAIITATSNLVITNCDFRGQYYTIVLQGNASATIKNCTASNNTGGIWVNGGIAILVGTTPDLMGGSMNRKDGGIIVKSNGTLL